MKKIILGLLILIGNGNLSFAQKSDVKAINKAETYVLITTDLGNIKVKLFNETPGHRDNFINLVKEGKYDGSIFHRVIPQFMVQGGGGPDGSKDLATPISHEITTKFIHKRGALAAARMGDDVNPARNSSGSQFYLVQGRSFTAEQINQLGQRTGFPYTAEQVEEYVKVGGAPHLDGAYTVFGEVLEGLEVIDKIAAVERNTADRPVAEIKMTMKLVKK